MAIPWFTGNTVSEAFLNGFEHYQRITQMSVEPSPPSPPFREVLGQYQSIFWKKLRTSTRTNDQHQANKRILPAFSHILIADIPSLYSATRYFPSCLNIHWNKSVLPRANIPRMISGQPVLQSGWKRAFRSKPSLLCLDTVIREQPSGITNACGLKLPMKAWQKHQHTSSTQWTQQKPTCIAQVGFMELTCGFEPVTSSLPKICFTWRVGFRMSLIRCTSTTKMYSICLTQHQKPQYDNKKDTKKVRKWIDNAQTYSYNEIRYQMREENGRGKARYFAEKD